MEEAGGSQPKGRHRGECRGTARASSLALRSWHSPRPPTPSLTKMGDLTAGSKHPYIWEKDNQHVKQRKEQNN